MSSMFPSPTRGFLCRTAPAGIYTWSSIRDLFLAAWWRTAAWILHSAKPKRQLLTKQFAFLSDQVFFFAHQTMTVCNKTLSAWQRDNFLRWEATRSHVEDWISLKIHVAAQTYTRWHHAFSHGHLPTKEEVCTWILCPFHRLFCGSSGNLLLTFMTISWFWIFSSALGPFFSVSKSLNDMRTPQVS